ncbi:hypothetical protein [Symbiopectobacterium sp. RP]|uniref:hypothetical protein n=1 Tax=Symbiopectobacterium sp. RP TaxID=3248553 RepID=UPI003D2AF3C3
MAVIIFKSVGYIRPADSTVPFEVRIALIGFWCASRTRRLSSLCPVGCANENGTAAHTSA